MKKFSNDYIYSYKQVLRNRYAALNRLFDKNVDDAVTVEFIKANNILKSGHLITLTSLKGVDVYEDLEGAFLAAASLGNYDAIISIYDIDSTYEVSELFQANHIDDILISLYKDLKSNDYIRCTQEIFLKDMRY